MKTITKASKPASVRLAIMLLGLAWPVALMLGIMLGSPSSGEARETGAHAQSVSFLDEPLDLIEVLAPLDGMEIYVNQSPRQVRVFAWGEWGSQCWTYLYASSTQSREGFTLNVELTTWWEVPHEPTGCGSSTVYWEAWIDLDVASLEPGSYTVQVNGATGTFTLPEPVTPTVTGTPPTITPTPTGTPRSCWSVVPSPDWATDYNDLEAVAAVSANDVWTVGYSFGGTTYQALTEHWNGSAWSVVPSPNVGTSNNYLLGVAAVSANDVWAVGQYFTGSFDRTLIEHWNGIEWSVVPSPNMPGDNSLGAVAAVSSSDVWAAGSHHDGPVYQTLIEHWDGNVWSIAPSPNMGIGYDYLIAVAAVSSSDAWAVGYYYDGAGLSTLIEHWNGSAWSIVPSPNVDASSNIPVGLAAVSGTDVWTVGYSFDGTTYQTLIEHWNGSAWSIVPSPNVDNVDNLLAQIAAVSANDVWAVGYYESSCGADCYIDYTLAEHWDGSAWSIVPSPNVGTFGSVLFGVAAVSADDLWAVGSTCPDADCTSSQTLTLHYSHDCLLLTPTPASTATSTSMATVTPTTTPAAQQVLVGHVTWQGPPAQPSVGQQLPITLTLKLGSTEYSYTGFTTDASGLFTVPVGSLPSGTYSWRAKGPRYLANSGTLSLSGAQVTNQEIGLMLAGDADDDNIVNSLDFNILRNAFGGSSDLRADFNNDGLVSSLDFNLMRGTFGVGGAPPLTLGNP